MQRLQDTFDAHYWIVTDRSSWIKPVTAITLGFALYKLFSPAQDPRKTTKVDPKLIPECVAYPLPLVGHVPALSKGRNKFLQECIGRYGSVFQLRIPGQNPYVVTGDLIPDIMKSSTKIVSFLEGIKTLVPSERIMELSYNHIYKAAPLNLRDKNPGIYPIKQNFKPNRMDVFSERIQTGLHIILKRDLDLKPGETKEIYIWEFLTNTISQMSCPCFAGTIVGNDPELISSMAVLTQKIIKAAAFLALFPTWLGDALVRCAFSVEKEIDITMRLLVPELNRTKEAILNGTSEVTFTSMLLSLPLHDGTMRTVEETAIWFKSIALASIHTTSHFSSFCLHELSCRPELVEDLRAEIRGLDSISPETTGTLPLMDSFFREVLRCNVDYLGHHSKAMQDVHLRNGQVIPKGSLILCALLLAHEQFNPGTSIQQNSTRTTLPLDQFDAYRFVGAGNGTLATDVDLSNLTFGLGGHACPGRFFASNEIKYMLSELIMRFNLSTRSGKRGENEVLLGMNVFPPKSPIIFTAL
ncbi:cytochrome P450 [Phycomyces nitens]|nr:cytochrome P450 [Phycomyces nitens]